MEHVLVKLSAPENENYSATIVRLENTFNLEGLDNLVGVTFFGLTALVSKDTPVGELGVLFPAECQLSMEMAKENNLHRHGVYNKDQGKSGYLEDNRRVRAIRLRGNQSNALFLGLDSLSWTGVKLKDLKEGDTFDTLNGKEICKKYFKRQKSSMMANKQAREEVQRVDKKFIPEHADSLNYWRNKKQIKSTDTVVVTQKLHGTSIRIGNTLVNRKMNLLEKALKKVGVKIQDKEYDNVYGSRKVIKDPDNPFQTHYYSEDLWSSVGRQLDDKVPQGFVLYGEIIGYVEGNAPIQKNYTYNLPVGNHELYLYRITYINPQGIQTDLSWDQIKVFCRDHGLKHVPELWVGKHKNFDIDKFVPQTEAVRYSDKYPTALPLSPDSRSDEGVCIRKEAMNPVILKAKSPIFLEHETEMLDKEVVDIEEDQK